MALRTHYLQQREKPYSEDFEHYTDGTCCAWDIAPKKNTHGDALKNCSPLEERSLHLKRISNDDFWRRNMDTHRIGQYEANSRTQNGMNCVKCHVSGQNERYL